MKELKKIVFIGLLPFFLGCNDFLEEEALDTFTSLNFPQTVEDAEALVNEAYRLAGAHYASFNYPDVVLYPTEFATTRRQGSGDVRAQLDNYEVNNANSRLASAWNGAYGVIRQANIAIGAAEGIGDDDPDKATYDRLAAEARVIRAYTYYDLLVIFGSVPLIIERLETLEDAERPVSPIAEIYDAIINDLTVAEPLLPHDYEDNSLGRVTRGAARALLGNVHLQRAMDPANVAQGTDLDNAVTWLRRVVDAADGGKAYTLEPEYENLFGLDNVSNNIKFSNEIIFQFWRDINACCRNAYYANSNPRDTGFGSAWGNTVAEVPFYLSFDEADDRFQVSFFDTIPNANGSGETIIYDLDNYWGDFYEHDGPGFQKWIDPNHDNTGSNNNVIVIRYAEVLLNLSEALTRQAGTPTSEALDLLNQVRDRADLADLDPAPTTLAEMEEAIFNELRWETAFEANGLTDAHRFFDIFKERIEAHSRYELPPIPVDAILDGVPRRFDSRPDIPITLTVDMLRMPIPLTEVDANSNID